MSLEPHWAVKNDNYENHIQHVLHCTGWGQMICSENFLLNFKFSLNYKKFIINTS